MAGRKKRKTSRAAPGPALPGADELAKLIKSDPTAIYVQKTSGVSIWISKRAQGLVYADGGNTLLAVILHTGKFQLDASSLRTWSDGRPISREERAVVIRRIADYFRTQLGESVEVLDDPAGPPKAAGTDKALSKAEKKRLKKLAKARASTASAPAAPPAKPRKGMITQALDRLVEILDPDRKKPSK